MLSPQPPTHRCRLCHATPAPYACSECESVFYCSPVHQQQDWAGHHHRRCIGRVASLTPPSPVSKSASQRFKRARDVLREDALEQLEAGNVRAALVTAQEAFRMTYGYHGGEHVDCVNDYLILSEVHTRFGLLAEAERLSLTAMRILAANPQYGDGDEEDGEGEEEEEEQQQQQWAAHDPRGDEVIGQIDQLDGDPYWCVAVEVQVSSTFFLDT